jgi:uncharacterized membrane protein YoaK (UPF0700 family)
MEILEERIEVFMNAIEKIGKIEAIALFLIGLIPTNTIDVLVTNLVSFLMGYQLCLFRNCLGIPFNTTICTGNIRNVGQLLFNVLDEESMESVKKFITYTILTFSFGVGAIPGTLVSLAISIKAVWLCSAILVFQAIWIYSYEKNYI